MPPTAYKSGDYVQLPAGESLPDGTRVVPVLGSGRLRVEERNAEGKVIGHRDIDVVTVKLDGESIGTYPAEKLTPAATPTPPPPPAPAAPAEEEG